MITVPLLIEFPHGTSLFREANRVSSLTILGNGPPGTFVLFPGQIRVSLPTDQVIWSDDSHGRAEVGFGGMRFTGLADGQLVFHRVRELHPEQQLSPARSYTMLLKPEMVSAIRVEGELVWPSL
jgi:hypothetical protein